MTFLPDGKLYINNMHEISHLKAGDIKLYIRKKKEDKNLNSNRFDDE